MHGLRLAGHLDWPRFLRVFLLVDLSSLVVPAWESVLRGRAFGESPALEEFRRLASDARMEMQDLLDEAAERSGRN